MIDRLPVPGGLLRSGVAPDHPATKRIGEGFAEVYRHPRVRWRSTSRSAATSTHDELRAAHSAVVYAVGAANDRLARRPRRAPAGQPLGHGLRGLVQRPSRPAPTSPSTSGRRAVVVGTGNVALDVARILLA